MKGYKGGDFDDGIDNADFFKDVKMKGFNDKELEDFIQSNSETVTANDTLEDAPAQEKAQRRRRVRSERRHLGVRTRL